MHIYYLRSRYKPALGGPAAGMHPSSLLKGQLVCHNNIALPSCHFMREEEGEEGQDVFLDLLFSETDKELADLSASRGLFFLLRGYSE